MATNLTAVIMAAGKGSRLLPLTATVPKPLLRLAGKTPLEYNLDNLKGRVSEVVIVVGHLKEKITNYLGDNYKGTKIRYVTQEKPTGNAQALFLTRETVGTKNILVLNGDDIYADSIVKQAVNSSGNMIAGKKETNWQNFGVLQTGKGGYLEKIAEKPEKFVGDLINIGFYKVSRDIYDYFGKISLSKRGEYEVTDMISLYAADHKIKVVECESGWTPLSFPWDMLSFTEKTLTGIKPKISGEIEKGAVIKGKLSLGKNSVIKSGAYLEGDFFVGENCTIGPNCHLVGFASIDDGTIIGQGVEVVRSVIGKCTKIKHLAYIGDSIVGNDVNIGAGTVTANVRHDGKNILVEVNEKLTDTNRRKFGAIIGDRVKTGINTSIFPGSVINQQETTLPGEVKKYNKQD